MSLPVWFRPVPGSSPAPVSMASLFKQSCHTPQLITAVTRVARCRRLWFWCHKVCVFQSVIRSVGPVKFVTGGLSVLQ